MDYRGVLATTMLLGATALVAVTASCSAADPATVNFSERPKGQTGDLTSGGTPTDGGSSGSSGTSGSSGGEAGADGGSSGLPITAFDPKKAYNAAGAANGDSQNGAHPNGGNPAGVDCMGCHSAAGGANAKWGIAGTVYNSSAGTAPVAKAEVRIVDATGKELGLVYSDDKGNFWADTIVGGIPAGSKIGVRNATVTKLMGTALAAKDSGCQQAGCHVAGSQGRVFLQ